MIEQFSLNCRKVTSLHYYATRLASKLYSRHFFIQSEVKPKQIVIRSHMFSRVLRQLHLFNYIKFWLVHWIDCSDNFGSGFTTLNWKQLERCRLNCPAFRKEAQLWPNWWFDIQCYSLLSNIHVLACLVIFLWHANWLTLFSLTVKINCLEISVVAQQLHRCLLRVLSLPLGCYPIAS